jgi:hypothetical protein
MPVRHSALALAAVSSALALAACGSSSSPGTSTGSGSNPKTHANFLAFSQCMRTHGVTNFPDPSSGGGIQLGSGSGINPFSPAFKAAQAQCGKLLPGGGPAGNGHPSKQALAQMLQISDCMRAHGVTGFPDPTTTPPSSPPAGGQILGRGGVFLIVPSTVDVNSPAYQRASSTCHFGGPPGGKPKSL